LWRRLLAYCKVAAPVYLFFLASIASTSSIASFFHQHLRFDIRSRRAADRSHAARNFPWSTPFHEGVFGALFKPEKSIFLFDPLLVLTLSC